MKLRLICIMTAAVLLVGCGDTSQSTESVNSQELSTEATTASTSAIAEAVISSEEHTTDIDGTEQIGQLSGGVTLTDKHKELRKLVSGAEQFCDFDELGVNLTVNSDFIDRALAISAQAEDFDPNYDKRGLGGIIGYDDGCFYFYILTNYGYITEEGEFATMYPAEGKTTVEHRYDHFCLDCDSGELTQIFPCEGYSKITNISSDVMVVSDGSSYAMVHRDSGYMEQLPDDIKYPILVNDKLFYPTPADGHYDLFYSSIDENELYSTKIKYTSSPYFKRGINNIVYNMYDYGDYVYFDILGNEYLTSEPAERMKDYIFDTYYQCTAMTEQNLLGWRTRLSITDQDGNESVIGYMQTKTKPDIDFEIKLHATKDGIILLRLSDEQSIVLLGKENDFSEMKAAFLPDITISYHYDIFCDDDRLYIFSNIDNTLITLSKENAGGDVS
ncbi:MAG: hypothetical protein E7485_04590 [Ruminococcaceae bacterium]|nr:hypothetical protein [Oscillospiraceae bacterium]